MINVAEVDAGVKSDQQTDGPESATILLVGVAKTYAGLGWRVFPVDGYKQPLIKEWQHQATTDPKIIDGWWGRWPDAMIGVACGPASGVAVVDADNKPDADGVTGLQHLERLEAQHGELDAPAAKTPSGGIHLFFGGASLPFAKNESRIAPKIDLRSARLDGKGAGYAVVAPSVTANGKGYSWHLDNFEPLRRLPDAPHWLAVMACFTAKERQAIASTEALKALLDDAPRAEWRGIFDAHQETERQMKATEKGAGPAGSGKPFTLDHPYIAKALDMLCSGLRDCRDAQNAKLFVTAASVGNVLAGAGLMDGKTLAQVTERLFNAAMEFPMLDPSEPWLDRKGKEQARKTIKSGLEKGLKNSRDLSRVTHPTSAKPSKKYLPDIILGSEAKPEATRWLRSGYLPYGEATLVAGLPKIGKSMASIDIAARVTTGEPFPMAPGLFTGATRPGSQGAAADRRDPAKVVIISAEDHVERTLVPRLILAGANMANVIFFQGVKAVAEDGTEIKERFVLAPEKIAALDQLLANDPAIVLITLDPIGAYFGQANTNQGSIVRDSLQPLIDLVRNRDVAMLIVGHLNKGSGQVADLSVGGVLNRIAGSGAFVQAPRVVHLVAKDPKDEARRLLFNVANNVTKEGDGFVFRIEQKFLPTNAPGAAVSELIESSRIVWSATETPGVSAAEAVNGVGAPTTDPDKRSFRSEALDLLIEQLTDGPVLKTDLQKAAKELDIPFWHVRDAARELGVEKDKTGFGKAPWEWKLPPVEARKEWRTQFPDVAFPGWIWVSADFPTWKKETEKTAPPPNTPEASSE
jgi:hypothetical protein